MKPRRRHASSQDSVPGVVIVVGVASVGAFLVWLWVNFLVASGAPAGSARAYELTHQALSWMALIVCGVAGLGLASTGVMIMVLRARNKRNAGIR